MPEGYQFENIFVKVVFYSPQFRHCIKPYYTTPACSNARILRGVVQPGIKNRVSVHRAPHLLCCRALEVQGVRLRTRTPRICSTL